MNLKESYFPYSDKYDLPSYDILDEEYELLYFQPICEIRYPLRFIRRRIIDKMNMFIHFFQNIIYPISGSIVSLEENNFLTEDDKKEVVELLKKMISLERESLLLDIDHDESSDGEFIQKVHVQWLSFKPRLVFFIHKLQKEWKEKTHNDIGEHYFG